jgi:hypothetical protein
MCTADGRREDAMTDEKWEALVGQIRRKFKVDEETMSEPDPRDRSVRETLVFTGPTGPMKLERVTRPLVLEKKPIYSGRAGAGVSYDYVLDPKEKTHRESLFRWENNGWTEMDLSAISR